MAEFKVHLMGGIAAGAGASAIGHFMAGLTLLQSGAVFVAGSVGGLLPVWTVTQVNRWPSSFT